MIQINRLRHCALTMFLLASGLLPLAHAATANPKVSISQENGKVIVKVGDRTFTEYHYQQVPRPFLYPLYGPGELPMTRNWPKKETGDEEKDHPHHKSFWFTHGEVNGVDFWADGRNKGVIQHAQFIALKSGNEGIIQS